MWVSFFLHSLEPTKIGYGESVACCLILHMRNLRTEHSVDADLVRRSIDTHFFRSARLLLGRAKARRSREDYTEGMGGKYIRHPCNGARV